MDIEDMLEKLGVCTYPRPGHICDQCSVYDHDWIEKKKEQEKTNG